MIIVRYADDIVVGFEHETDAQRFWDAMSLRSRTTNQTRPWQNRNLHVSRLHLHLWQVPAGEVPTL
jgi:hypothetical protein